MAHNRLRGHQQQMRSKNSIKQILRAFTPPVIWWAARSLSIPSAVLPKNLEGIRELDCMGFRWKLDMKSLIAREIATKGVWERDTTDLVLDLVKPGMKVLSIGANFGYYVMLMARCIGEKGHVWAFEPVQLFRDQLRWHVETNGFSDRVTIVPYGLSDSEVSATIHIQPQSASLHYAPSEAYIGSEIINVSTLDSLAERLAIGRVDFISMDVDGHETAVLRGARKTLSRDLPPIAMEFAQACLHVAGSNVSEVAALLHEIGYEICSEKTRRPYGDEFAFLRDCANYSSYTNALAVPRGAIGAIVSGKNERTIVGQTMN